MDQGHGVELLDSVISLPFEQTTVNVPLKSNGLLPLTILTPTSSFLPFIQSYLTFDVQLSARLCVATSSVLRRVTTILDLLAQYQQAPIFTSMRKNIYIYKYVERRKEKTRD